MIRILKNNSGCKSNAVGNMLVRKFSFAPSGKHCRDFLCRGKQALRLFERVAISESVNRDLNRVSVWCNLWGMKLKANKTKTMIVSRSRTVHPQLTPLTLDRTALKESADLLIFG